ncbi:MAG: hypothetical protein NC337_06630 [Roseburia sp.]|nr:hypothetical protein [Roseburia sp.]
MGKTIEICFDKLYRYPRNAEPCCIGIPLKEGALANPDRVAVLQEGRPLPIQRKVTSRHKDGSVRFLFLRFAADLPANRGAVLQCELDSEKTSAKEPMRVVSDGNGIQVDTGALAFEVQNGSSHIFSWLETEGRRYAAEQFVGPLLQDGGGNAYEPVIHEWKIVETGEVCTILKADGANRGSGEKEKRIDFELKLTAYADKPWVEVSYRIINTTDEALQLASLVFDLKRKNDASVTNRLNADNAGETYTAEGLSELAGIEKMTSVSDVRTCVATSNYKTSFEIGAHGTQVGRAIDADWLVGESNEHFAEVFYGTFFADCTDAEGGVCATVFQAYQNFPKAVRADGDGVSVMLVPEGVGRVVMESGMSREQRFLLHFHGAQEPLAALDNRSLIYQMPDRPYVKPEVHRESGVYVDIFSDSRDAAVEQAFIAKADGHTRAYGMLHFGDVPDMNYTTQGRGGGDLVWTNNEYDFPHACALLYARTGIRRFLDYAIAAASHWMDVDVCHYSANPLFVGGQWEHTNGHCKGNVIPQEKLMVCSHQWVEGLLDYYHFTGDERGLETALGIGENVLRLLDTPMYSKVGELNARETGWALRSLTALYVETRDAKWLSKSARILEDFRQWAQQYGEWLAPYTDNTVIRVGFMISVALGSVMRYYREFPSEDIRQMMLRAVEDLIENCYMERTGLFEYKELPSLNRLGGNTLLLEALAIAYELTGDGNYLRYGEQTFQRAVRDTAGGSLGKKTICGDAVVVGSGSTKNFAQSFIPLALYYKALQDWADRESREKNRENGG